LSLSWLLAKISKFGPTIAISIFDHTAAIQAQTTLQKISEGNDVFISTPHRKLNQSTGSLQGCETDQKEFLLFDGQQVKYGGIESPHSMPIGGSPHHVIRLKPSYESVFYRIVDDDNKHPSGNKVKRILRAECPANLWLWKYTVAEFHSEKRNNGDTPARGIIQIINELRIPDKKLLSMAHILENLSGSGDVIETFVHANPPTQFSFPRRLLCEVLRCSLCALSCCQV